MTESMQNNSIAIIGASSGQLPLVLKARDMGLETHCFSWLENDVCTAVCDRYHQISIFSYDEICDVCRSVGVNGVVSNASEETAVAVSEIGYRLGLPVTPPAVIRLMQNKEEVRKFTAGIDGLAMPKVYTPTEIGDIEFPCVVKPIKGSAKRGVSYCSGHVELNQAIEYARTVNDSYIVEEYISGSEYSVETLSAGGRHQVVQVTRKVSSGPPHFVELEHHQPAILDSVVRSKIDGLTTKILDTLGYTDGAAHIEIKINGADIYLIEVNPRGGGDHISDTLVAMSTDCDYLKCIIEIALGKYYPKSFHTKAYCGIMYLSAQNGRIKNYFDAPPQLWLVQRVLDNPQLTTATSNYDRNGYIIYQSTEPIEL